MALAPRKRRFVELFMGQCAGNGTAAAQAAGYGKGPRSAATIASRLLRKVDIQKAIAERVARRETKSIANAAERDQLLSDIVRDRSEETFNRLRAVDLLNKAEGRYSRTLNVKGRLTLEQALDAASRK